MHSIRMIIPNDIWNSWCGLRRKPGMYSMDYENDVVDTTPVTREVSEIVWRTLGTINVGPHSISGMQRSWTVHPYRRVLQEQILWNNGENA